MFIFPSSIENIQTLLIEKRKGSITGVKEHDRTTRILDV